MLLIVFYVCCVCVRVIGILYTTCTFVLSLYCILRVRSCYRYTVYYVYARAVAILYAKCVVVLSPYCMLRVQCDIAILYATYLLVYATDMFF